MRMHIEGYAIVSEDGMIADAAGHMPAVLTVEADQKFFHDSLDRAALVVHGRHSCEGGPRASGRKRLIVTRTVAALAPHAAHRYALCWNPAGASLSEALQRLEINSGILAVIGGTDVYELFWQPGYDAFHLTRVAGARLPGGRPVFRALASAPGTTPEQVLTSHGLVPDPEVTLAPGVSLVTWRGVRRVQPRVA